MERLLRMIPHEQFIAIRNGKYTEPKVPVYFSFNTYRWDIEYINRIVAVIKREHPGIAYRDMNVQTITKKMSNTHAEYRTVQVMLLTSSVQAHLSDYTVL